MATRKTSASKQRLHSLLASGFFPKEYPPPFSTKAFADLTASDTFVLQFPAGHRLTTTPAIHNLARPGGSRRKLHVPNPFSYYQLCDLISKYWTKISAHYRKATISVSNPVTDLLGIRAFIPQSEGSELALYRAQVRNNARVILRTDISRFYSSIYTHSIPWALETKTKAKRKRKGGFSNSLDQYLRDLQDGQTLGIPVGPDASLIVAEIVGTAIDERLADAGLSGFRFMDDYELGFPDRASAEKALSKLEEILAEFELAVNPRKTSIDQLPIELERPWIAEIKSYAFSEPLSTGDLIVFFNRVFELKKQYPHDPVLAYAVARLRSVQFTKFPLLENLLNQCALNEPGTIEPAVTLLQEMEKRGSGAVSQSIDSVLHKTIEIHSDLNHGSELAWALWAAIWFKRKIPGSLAKKLDGNSDPAVGILTFYAREKGLINRKLAFPRWQNMMTRQSLSGPLWLLTYEAIKRGWVKRRYSYLTDDCNFSQIARGDVLFFDDTVAAPTKTILYGATPSTLGIYDTTSEEWKKRRRSAAIINSKDFLT